MVKAKRLLSIINFYGEMFEKEMRDKLGITYYTHEEHYPILEKWMIDHNCPKDDYFILAFRDNGLIAWEMISNYQLF